MDTPKRWTRVRIIEYLIYAVAFLMPLQPMAGDVALWLAMLLGAYDSLRRGDIHKPSGYLSYLVLAFLAWSGLSSITSHYALWSLGGWTYQVLPAVGIYFLMSIYMVGAEQRRRFLEVFLGSAFFVCLIGLYQYILVPLPEMQEWVDPQAFPELKRRMASTLFNPNLLGAYLLMALAVVGSYLLVYGKAKDYRSVFKVLPITILLILCMLLTYSRGIWISFAAMVFYWAVAVDRRIFLTFLLVPIVLFFYHGEVAVRLWSLFMGTDTSSAMRWALWDSTSYIIKDYPILGTGWNTFIKVYPDYNYFIQDPVIRMFHAHNMYLNYLAEIGIPGTLILMATFLGHVVKASRLTGTRFMRAAHYGVAALVVAMLVSGLSDHELYSHQVNIIFWQLLGWGAALIKSSKSWKKVDLVNKDNKLTQIEG